MGGLTQTGLASEQCWSQEQHVWGEGLPWHSGCWLQRRGKPTALAGPTAHRNAEAPLVPHLRVTGRDQGS